MTTPANHPGGAEARAVHPELVPDLFDQLTDAYRRALSLLGVTVEGCPATDGACTHADIEHAVALLAALAGRSAYVALHVASPPSAVAGAFLKTAADSLESYLDADDHTAAAQVPCGSGECRTDHMPLHDSGRAIAEVWRRAADGSEAY